MKAIFNRELDSYFNSMLGYVFLTIFLLMTGVMFTLANLMSTSASMTGFFSNINGWSMFILPILTMRMFSEDKKLKTDQLLLTAPISIWSMVLGKFFAAFCVLLTGTAITLFYPITINFFGNVALGETISCYVGFILLCAVIISIGAFMSSLTESQIVAALSTYGVLILTLFIGSAASAVSNEVISNILMWISPIQRFSSFTMGILDLESIVYYLSLTVLFLFLTVTVFEKRRFK